MAIKQKMEQPNISELKPDWHVVDAEGKTLGRISLRNCDPSAG